MAVGAPWTHAAHRIVRASICHNAKGYSSWQYPWKWDVKAQLCAIYRYYMADLRYMYQEAKAGRAEELKKALALLKAETTRAHKEV